MIKNLKKNQTRKNLFIYFFLILLYFAYNFIIVAYRAEASLIDKETDSLIASIDSKKQEMEKINQKINEVKKIHQSYLEKVGSQKNLTIDANILQSEIANLVDMLNKYYDNTVFKLKLKNVVQNDDYINVAEINILFEFFHKLQGTPDVAKQLEKSVIDNVYSDIVNNFSEILVLDKKLSVINYDTNTVKLFFIKER